MARMHVKTGDIVVVRVGDYKDKWKTSEDKEGNETKKERKTA